MESNVKLSKRLGAYLLDIFLVYLLITLISSIRFINPNYDKYIESYDKYSKVVEKYYKGEISSNELISLNQDNLYKVSKYSVSYNIVMIVVIIGYFGFFQKYNKGQTLGKKIMKIKVVSTEDKEASLGAYLLRILPMYYVLVGNILSILINSILVYFLNSKTFIYANSIVIYLFLAIGIISFVMMNIRKDKRGLQDIIAKTKVVAE